MDNDTSTKWYEAEGIDQSHVSEKVKTFTNEDGSCNMAEFIKSYNSAESYIGGAVKMPTEKSSPEEVRAFYSKLGCPETADKYEWKQPEGIEVKGEAFETFKKNAYDLGLTNKQLSGVLDGYAGIVKDLYSQQQVALQQQKDTTTANLKKDWGDTADSKIKSAIARMEEDGVKELFESMGILHDERVIRSYNRITSNSQSSSFKDGKMTTDAINARIGEIRKDPAYLNAAHPNHDALIKEHNSLCAQKSTQ